MSRTSPFLAAALLFLLVLVACNAAPSPAPTGEPGTFALPTLDTRAFQACAGVGTAAALAGDANDPRVAWLVSGGKRVDVVFPYGSRARFVPGLEVVNLGVDGYGTDQELIRLEREGLAYHPRVVVLNFCLRNDYFDNALPVALYDGRSPKPYFTLDAGTLTRHDAHLRLSRRQRLAETLMERSFLVNALLRLGGAPPDTVGEGRDEEDWGERRQAVLADFERASDLTRRLILAVGEQSAAAGAAFVVVLHPDRRAWSGDETMVTPLTSGALARTRIVHMRREYEARHLRFEDLTIDRLGHLGPNGHQAAAEIIHAVIDSSTGRR